MSRPTTEGTRLVAEVMKAAVALSQCGPVPQPDRPIIGDQRWFELEAEVYNARLALVCYLKRWGVDAEEACARTACLAGPFTGWFDAGKPALRFLDYLASLEKKAAA